MTEPQVGAGAESASHTGKRDTVSVVIWGALGVLVACAWILPGGSADPVMGRALATVWVTIALLVPTYAYVSTRSRTHLRWSRWRAAWTAALVSFLIHSVVAITGPLGGSLGAMFDSPFVSTPWFNLVITLWWTVDVVLAWGVSAPSDGAGGGSAQTGWLKHQRTALHVVLLIAFTIATVVQGSSTARLLGVVLLVTAVLGFVLRKGHRPAVVALSAAGVAVVAGLLIIPGTRAEIWSLSDCTNLAVSGFRPVATDRSDRFLGKVASFTARCRGGSDAVAYRDTPWVDWSNYYGTGDSTSLAIPWSPLGPLSPAGRGIDGALLDLEYQRIELIRYNLFDNSGTFREYALGRDGVGGGALRTWPEMRLDQEHPRYADVGGADEQMCWGDLIRFRTPTGICNDIRNPAMGSTGMLFARNVTFDETFPLSGTSEFARNRHGNRLGLLTPDPQVISRRLFTRPQGEPELCNDGSGLPDDGAEARCDYQPAPFFNVLAAFWIQFMTHDWFSHLDEGRNGDQLMAVGCPADVAGVGCRPADRMEEALFAEPAPSPGFTDASGQRQMDRAPRVSSNNVTAWWDASQLYGYDDTSASRAKRDPADPAKLLLVSRGAASDAGAMGYLPLFEEGDPINPEWSGQESVGFPDNWSLGLSFFSNVFAREHNVFVDGFREVAARTPDDDSGLRHPDAPERVIRYRDVTAEELFQIARLVVAAEIAKIHTIEWTTQLLYDEPLYRAMNSNWSGLFSGSDFLSGVTERLVERLQASSEVDDATQWFSVFASGAGIFGLGSRRFDITEGRDVWDLANPDHVNGGVNHFGSPFNFPEEFTTVYRLHPLIPDLIEFRDLGAPDRISRRVPVVGSFRGAATEVMATGSMGDWALSMGRQRLGLLTLRNHPLFLQNLPIPAARSGSGQLDVLALDIIRDREHGIPRFNEFRRQYGLRTLSGFDDFIDARLPDDSPARRQQTEVVEILREVYGQHRCDDSLVITHTQTMADGSPITDCLGHPDGTLVDNIEDLDTVVGYLAESTRPHGFAISETQFVVFILNASRRLFSDRFFTSSFRPEFYSQFGVNWVNDNGPGDKRFEPEPDNGHMVEVAPLKRVLLRTIPELESELQTVVNAFDPWARDRGGYYSLRWAPRAGAEGDESFRQR